jgi:hypothetical protein
MSLSSRKDDACVPGELGTVPHRLQVGHMLHFAGYSSYFSFIYDFLCVDFFSISFSFYDCDDYFIFDEMKMRDASNGPLYCVV